MRVDVFSIPDSSGILVWLVVTIMVVAVCLSDNHNKRKD